MDELLRVFHETTSFFLGGQTSAFSFTSLPHQQPPQSLTEAKKPASSWTARVDPPPETRRLTTHPTKRRKKDPGHGSWQCPIRAASDSGRGSACIACHFDQPHRQGRVSNPTVSVRPLTFFFAPTAFCSLSHRFKCTSTVSLPRSHTRWKRGEDADPIPVQACWHRIGGRVRP
jgi:hypothetical protein